MPEKVRFGIIGLDTSHVTAFTELLYNETHPHHVPGGEVVAAFPGGSADFSLSVSRLEGFTKELRERYGVRLVDEIADLADRCEAFLLESVDGRVHLPQFAQIVPYQKPIFVDKPFAVSYADAVEMVRLSEHYQTPVMSCSALRYCDALSLALAQDTGGEIVGCDTFGPMAMQETQPGLFWYGIHSVEMLTRVLGCDCLSVVSTSTENHDVIVGQWADGRIGTIRGTRSGNYQFGALLHRETSSQFVDVSGCKKPYYASLLEEIVQFAHSGVSSCAVDETLFIVRFIECANESRRTGKMVPLA